MVDGDLFGSGDPVRGLGKITPLGEEELKKPFHVEFSSSEEHLRMLSVDHLDKMIRDRIHSLNSFNDVATIFEAVLERMDRFEKRIAEKPEDKS